MEIIQTPRGTTTEQEEKRNEQEAAKEKSESSQVADDETNDGGDSSSSSADAYNTGHLPLHWLIPKEDTINNNANTGETTTSFPSSFEDLRRKTHESLYDTAAADAPRRRKPKNASNAPAYLLVDLINSHPRYCTLAGSCFSGRISLSDPDGGMSTEKNKHPTNTSSMENETTTTSSRFPNGESTAAANSISDTQDRGRLVFRGHEAMDPEVLVEAMANGGTNQRNSASKDHKTMTLLQQPRTFRFEPLQLDVAAASAEDARKLLAIALRLGFLDSRLVVGSSGSNDNEQQIITVAIRNNSLATATPLLPASSKPTPSSKRIGASLPSLSAPPEYLRALVLDANHRLSIDHTSSERLYRSIQSTFFEIRTTPPPLLVRSAAAAAPPPLNLRNASAAALASTRSNNSSNSGSNPEPAAVYVLGGCGRGPLLLPESLLLPETSPDGESMLPKPPPLVSASPTAAAKRSSTKLYKLERNTTSNSTNSSNTKEWTWKAIGRTSASEKHLQLLTKKQQAPKFVSPKHKKWKDRVSTLKKKRKTKQKGEVSPKQSPKSSPTPPTIIEHIEDGVLEIPSRRIKSNKGNTTKEQQPSKVRIRWWNDMAFPDLEGAAACAWRDSLVLYLGGRGSSSEENDDTADVLYVLDTSDGKARFGDVPEIRGADRPIIRKGRKHKLLALSGDRFVLVGGYSSHKNDLDHGDGESSSDVFVLHYRGYSNAAAEKEEGLGGNSIHTSNNNNLSSSHHHKDEAASHCFYWERLKLSERPTPRGDFGAAVLHNNKGDDGDDDILLVVGGLAASNSTPRGAKQHPSAVWACRIGPTTTASKKKLSITTATPTTEISVDLSGVSSVGSLAGASCCTLLGENLLLATGGTTLGTAPFAPLRAFWISSGTSRLSLHEIGHDHKTLGGSTTDNHLEFLVHHSCVPISDHEVLLVGGDLLSPTSGESPARSYHLSIGPNDAPQLSEKPARTEEIGATAIEESKSQVVVDPIEISSSTGSLSSSDDVEAKEDTGSAGSLSSSDSSEAKDATSTEGSSSSDGSEAKDVASSDASRSEKADYDEGGDKPTTESSEPVEEEPSQPEIINGESVVADKPTSASGLEIRTDIDDEEVVESLSSLELRTKVKEEEEEEEEDKPQVVEVDGKAKVDESPVDESPSTVEPTDDKASDNASNAEVVESEEDKTKLMAETKTEASEQKHETGLDESASKPEDDSSGSGKENKGRDEICEEKVKAQAEIESNPQVEPETDVVSENDDLVLSDIESDVSSQRGDDKAEIPLDSNPNTEHQTTSSFEEGNATESEFNQPKEEHETEMPCAEGKAAETERQIDTTEDKAAMESDLGVGNETGDAEDKEKVDTATKTGDESEEKDEPESNPDVVEHATKIADGGENEIEPEKEIPIDEEEEGETTMPDVDQESVASDPLHEIGDVDNAESKPNADNEIGGEDGEAEVQGETRFVDEKGQPSVQGETVDEGGQRIGADETENKPDIIDNKDEECQGGTQPEAKVEPKTNICDGNTDSIDDHNKAEAGSEIACDTFEKDIAIDDKETERVQPKNDNSENEIEDLVLSDIESEVSSEREADAEHNTENEEASDHDSVPNELDNLDEEGFEVALTPNESMETQDDGDENDAAPIEPGSTNENDSLPADENGSHPKESDGNDSLSNEPESGENDTQPNEPGRRDGEVEENDIALNEPDNREDKNDSPANRPNGNDEGDLPNGLDDCIGSGDTNNDTCLNQVDKGEAADPKDDLKHNSGDGEGDENTLPETESSNEEDGNPIISGVESNELLPTEPKVDPEAAPGGEDKNEALPNEKIIQGDAIPKESELELDATPSTEANTGEENDTTTDAPPKEQEVDVDISQSEAEEIELEVILQTPISTPVKARDVEQAEEERDENDAALPNEPKTERNAVQGEVEEDFQDTLSKVAAKVEKSKNAALPEVEPDIEGFEVVPTFESVDEDEFYECYSSPCKTQD